MKTRRHIKYATVVMLLGYVPFLVSCASVINGSKQKVEIKSQPAGASVRINSVDSGVTPQTAVLSRKMSHRIELQKSGYRLYEVVLEPAYNNMPMGNMIAGGIVGLVVDSSTGAANTLHPDKVDAVLIKK